jgi:hypothetical protein
MMDSRTKQRIADDPFGIHEALDRASILTDFFACRVAEHPAVELRPEIAALANKAITAMHAVYQALGQLDSPSGEE